MPRRGRSQCTERIHCKTSISCGGIVGNARCLKRHRFPPACRRVPQQVCAVSDRHLTALLFSQSFVRTGGCLAQKLLSNFRKMSPQLRGLLPQSMTLWPSAALLKVESNRHLFRALFMHVQRLSRRGCLKTAFECCKFLLSLDTTDPLGTLCMIDYLAIRAGACFL